MRTMRHTTVITTVLCLSSMLFAQKIEQSTFWQNLQAGTPQKLLISGSSTCQAYGSDMHDKSGKSFVDWPVKLKEALEEQFGAGSIDMVMATCAGVTSKVLMGEDPNKSHIGRKFIDFTIDAAADAVLMEWAVGADCADKFGLPSSESKQYHLAAIEELRQNPDTEIFLWTGARSTGSKWNERNGGDEGQPDYAEMIRQVAQEKNCYLVDTYDDFQQLYEQLGESGYSSNYIPDGNHTSTKAAEEIIVPEFLQAFQGYGPPPAFTVTAPSSGNSYNIGESVTVTWEWNPDSIDDVCELKLSVDGGQNWAPIPNAYGLDASDPNFGSFTFTIPETVDGRSAVSDQAMVKIKVYESETHALSPLFTVRPADFVEVFDTLDSYDERVSLSGEWSPSSAKPPFYGTNYLHDGNTAKGSKSATFAPGLTVAGTYEVVVIYSPDDNRATNVPVVVEDAAGQHSLTMNQQSGDGYHSLGTFTFTADSPGSVTISNTGTDGFVIADAVAFILVSTSTDIARPMASRHELRGGGMRAGGLYGLAGGTYRLSVPAQARRVELFNCAGRLIAARALDARTQVLDLRTVIAGHGMVYARFLTRP